VFSDAGWSKLDLAERDNCRPVFLRLSLTRNLEEPVMSLYGTDWRELGLLARSRFLIGKNLTTFLLY
jgi:hypothetical protein